MLKCYIRYNFTRQNLFELVWSKPAIKIAEELHIPYLELKKVCLSYKIPRPTNIYWAKLASNKKVNVPVLPTDNRSREKKISIKVRNPEYVFRTRDDDTKHLRDYILSKVLKQREKNRKAYVLDLLKRAHRYEEINQLFVDFKTRAKNEASTSLCQMFNWIEKWLESEREKITLAFIDREIRASKLFDNEEFDFDPETWESDWLHFDEIEQFFLHLDDKEDEYGEEVIEWSQYNNENKPI